MVCGKLSSAGRPIGLRVREKPIAGGPQGQQHPEATLYGNRPAGRVTHQQDREATPEAQQIAVIDRAPRGDVQQASESEQIPTVL